MSVVSTAFSAATNTATQVVKAGSLVVRSGAQFATSLFGRGSSATENAAEALQGQAAAGRGAASRSSSDTVIDLTSTEPAHMPFPAYDRLSGDSVMRHIRDSEDLAHLREIEAFEQTHKARKGVLQALESRFAELPRT